MEDMISRKKAIETMEGVDWYHINKDGQLTHGANSKKDETLYKAEDVYKVLNDVPSAQPTEASCWGCNCPKMERLKEQKTFLEMVHLHDAETHGNACVRLYQPAGGD